MLELELQLVTREPRLLGFNQIEPKACGSSQPVKERIRTVGSNMVPGANKLAGVMIQERRKRSGSFFVDTLSSKAIEGKEGVRIPGHTVGQSNFLDQSIFPYNFSCFNCGIPELPVLVENLKFEQKSFPSIHFSLLVIKTSIQLIMEK